ncbi:MAG: cupin domain-containing protein [Planctomycetota bacterium]|nr:cupin domain-containing protein [Planctomycetota bacterium]
MEGTGEFVIAGKPLPAHAGRLLIMPANVPHAVNAHERFKMLLTMVRKRV